MDEWKKLFKHAVDQIDAAGIPTKAWAFGGGTVLMQRFNHRASKDIDIFISDPQLLSRLSPRLNDALEAHVSDYAEQSNFVRLYFAQGEIDFIVAKNITNNPTQFKRIEGVFCHVETPVEIVAKKIAYRGDSFRPRDVFDLALVYSECRSSVLENANSFLPYIDTLTDRLATLVSDPSIPDALEAIHALPGAKIIRGKELQICLEFSKAITLEAKRTRAHNCGLHL